MESLLAVYASSDEEDDKTEQPNPRSSHPKGEGLIPKSGNLLSSLPPPRSSSSSLFSSLPSLKVQKPIPSISVNKNSQQLHDEVQQLREDPGLPPSVLKPSSSLFTSLPQPKSSSSSSSSLFSSLPLPKTQNTEQQVVPQSSLASPAPVSRKVVQFRPPTMNPPADFGDEDEDDEEEEEEKQRKKSESSIQTSSVKSFLSSIPKPKNSTTLGALPSASGTGRRSMLEAEVSGSNDSDIRNAESGSIAGHKSADNLVSVISTSDANGSSDFVPSGDYSTWGSKSENFVNYDGCTGYGNSRVDGEDYSNLGGGTVDYANYGGDYGSYASYGQYQSNWTDGSTANTGPQMSGSAENVLRMPGKRGRNDAPPEIVEVKQDELMKNRPREDQVKLTGIAFGPSYQPASTKGKPTKLHKRKHQIGSLFYDMKQKEGELAERRARGFLTKAQTQGKYGW